MPYHTNRFLFNVPAHYFLGVKVTTPFFMDVEYSYQRERFIEVLNVTISIRAIGKLALGDNLVQEIQDAAKRHHQKATDNPDDLIGILEGMPNKKKE